LEHRHRALVVVEKDLKDSPEHHAKRTEPPPPSGPTGRADRDFRPQTMMTFRTLL